MRRALDEFQWQRAKDHDLKRDSDEGLLPAHPTVLSKTKKEKHQKHQNHLHMIHQKIHQKTSSSTSSTSARDRPARYNREGGHGTNKTKDHNTDYIYIIII